MADMAAALETAGELASITTSSINNLWNLHFFVIFGLVTTYAIALGAGRVVIPGYMRLALALATAAFGAAVYLALEMNYTRLYALQAFIAENSDAQFAALIDTYFGPPGFEPLHTQPVGVVLALLILAIKPPASRPLLRARGLPSAAAGQNDR